jgi:hypothetical protein
MSQTPAILQEFLKSWMPWITVGGLAIRVYTKLRERVTTWADTLLDNHLTHLQGSMDRLEAKTEANLTLQEKQIVLLSRIADK